MGGSDTLAQALFDALETAEPSELRELQRAIEIYRFQYHRTWRHMPPLARKLLEAMETAVGLASGKE